MKLPLEPGLLFNVFSQRLTTKHAAELLQAKGSPITASEEQNLASAIYHGRKQEVPDPRYSRPYVVTPDIDGETFDETLDRLDKAYSLLYHDTYHLAEGMFHSFEELEQQVIAADPQLKDKHWDFSVDKTGKVVAIGSLSSTQRSKIERVLNSDELFVALANQFKESFLEGAELERGPQNKSQYWGKYDVTNENFHKVFEFKELFKASDQKNLKEEHRHPDFKLDIYLFWNAVPGLLAMNAEVKFSDSRRSEFQYSEGSQV